MIAKTIEIGRAVYDLGESDWNPVAIGIAIAVLLPLVTAFLLVVTESFGKRVVRPAVRRYSTYRGHPRGAP